MFASSPLANLVADIRDITTPGKLEGKVAIVTGGNGGQLLNGPGYPEDAANRLLFLASDDGRFIAAEAIDLGGGCGAKV